MDSFSKLVRDELVRQELTQCGHCVKAELTAVVHMAGSIHLAGADRLALSMTVESAGVARRITRLLKASFKLQSEIRMENFEKLGKHHRYSILIPAQTGLKEMLNELGILNQDRFLDADIKPGLVKGSCCRASFIRGAFLTGGSITDPQKSTYHMELVTANEEFANGLEYLMNLLGLKAKISQRKEHFVVYLKDSEIIAKFLSVIGAHQALMKLEEVRVIKNLRGEVNRLVNCETANLEKSLSAAWEQVELIRSLMNEGKFTRLPEALSQTAKLRLEYPDSSLKELGEYHLPPISKSAVNHRLRQIREIAKNLT